MAWNGYVLSTEAECVQSNASTYKVASQYKIYWREVVHFDDLSQQNDPAREKILLSEAVLGNVQIRSSAVEISNFKSSPIFLQIPVCVVFAHLVIHFRLNFRV